MPNLSNVHQTNPHMDTQGIQQLLVAEKRAAEKVCEAKRRKSRRMKQAREEAEAEIERYKAHREKQFLDYEVRYLGNKDDIAAKVEHDVALQINECDLSVEQNKEAVIEDLLSYVMDIEPVIPRNYFILKSFNKI